MEFKQVLSYFLTGAALLSVTTTALAAEHPVDVQTGAWYQPAVEYVLENNLMDITQEDTFTPDNAVTRQAVADAIYRDAQRQGLEPDISVGKGMMQLHDYAQLEESYLPGLAYCFNAGILTGDNKGYLHATETITREEFAAVLARYDQILLNRAAAETTGRPVNVTEFANWYEAEAEMQAFTDYNTISAWARESVTACLADNLLHGNADGTFAPQAQVTRAELAQILYHFSRKA